MRADLRVKRPGLVGLQRHGCRSPLTYIISPRGVGAAPESAPASAAATFTRLCVSSAAFSFGDVGGRRRRGRGRGALERVVRHPALRDRRDRRSRARRRAAARRGEPRPAPGASNGEPVAFGDSRRVLRPEKRDVVLRADPDRDEVLVRDLRRPDDVRRQREEEVRPLVLVVDVREERADERQVSEERNRASSSSRRPCG